MTHLQGELHPRWKGGKQESNCKRCGISIFWYSSRKKIYCTKPCYWKAKKFSAEEGEKAEMRYRLRQKKYDAKKYIENPERRKQAVYRWREVNHEKAKAYLDAYRRDNAGYRAWLQAYRQSERHKVAHAMRQHQRRAKIGPISRESIQAIEKIKKGGAHCSYCRRELPYAHRTIDHIVPIRLAEIYGGNVNEPTNLVIACMSCNSSKGKKTIQQWRPDLSSMFGWRADPWKNG